MIRKAVNEDIWTILEVVKDAKELFKKNKSLQWQDSDDYPNYQTFLEDINNDSLYVNIRDNQIVGLCAIVTTGEQTYDKIYQGSWLNDEDFYVIHRLAVRKDYYGKKVAKELMLYAENLAITSNVHNMRADTTVENSPMNNLLISLGYSKCGIIYLNRNVNNNTRMAYQKILD